MQLMSQEMRLFFTLAEEKDEDERKKIEKDVFKILVKGFGIQMSCSDEKEQEMMNNFFDKEYDESYIYMARYSAREDLTKKCVKKIISKYPEVHFDIWFCDEDCYDTFYETTIAYHGDELEFKYDVFCRESTEYYENYEDFED